MDREVHVQAIDEVFFNLDTANNHQQIAALVLLRGTPEFQSFKKDIQRLLANFPKLTQKLCPGLRAHWRSDDEFSLDRHVVLRDCPGVSTEAELYSVASKEFSRPIPLDKPLWRFTMIRGQESRDQSTSAVLFSYHHSLTDGVGGLELIKLLFTNTAAQRPKLKIVKRNRRQSKQSLKISFAGINWKRSFAHWLKELFSKKVSSPLNGKNSPERAVHGLNLPWESFQSIRELSGASANDIVLCVVSEAVRAYERKRNITLHDTRIIMPVSLRKISERYDFGNKLTGVGLPLPVAEKSQRVRLELIRENSRELKESGVLGAYAHLGNYVAKLPAFLQRLICEIQAHRTNFIVTNMPGVKRRSFLAGAQVEQYHGLAALMKGHGAAFGFIRYADSLSAAVVCDPAIVKHPEELTKALKQALEELRAAYADEEQLDRRASA